MKSLVKIKQFINFIWIRSERSSRSSITHPTEPEMKVFSLIFTALWLANVAQGFDYELKCTKDEVGIRWPSYFSSSAYYMCTTIGGKQVEMSCGQGELFTFVLQSCTSPGRYIPAPPMNILPTSSPINVIDDLSALPKPLHSTEDQPSIISVPQQPPVINGEQSKPINLGEHTKESEKPSETKEEPAPAIKPLLPSKPSKPQSNGVTVPLPPTPEPTPPVVKKPIKPQAPVHAKKPLATPNKKQPPTATKKKLVQPSKKQEVPQKNEPKAQKKPPTPKKPAPSKE